MTSSTTTILSLSLLLATTTTTALAETEAASASDAMPAADNALELTMGAHFAQGAGDLGGDLPAVQDVAGPGIGLEAAIGWRVNANLLLGGYVNLSGFGDSNDASKGAVTFAAGIKADWHFQPASDRDPWISLGTGVKFLGIEDGDKDRALTGLELAKVQVGLDYRLSPRFAIGPVLGASATMFNHQYDDTMSDDAMAIDDKAINWTFSAGILGRFDTN